MPEKAPYHGLEYPVPYDISNEDEDIWGDILNETIITLDKKVINRGSLTERPSAGTDGRLYLDDDTFSLYYDNVNNWQKVGGQFTARNDGNTVIQSPTEIDVIDPLVLENPANREGRLSIDESAFVGTDGDRIFDSLEIESDAEHLKLDDSATSAGDYFFVENVGEEFSLGYVDESADSTLDVLTATSDGDVEIPNGILHSDQIRGNSAIRTDNATLSTVDNSSWSVYDSGNERPIVEFFEGGDVEIPNGALNVGNLGAKATEAGDLGVDGIIRFENNAVNIGRQVVGNGSLDLMGYNAVNLYAKHTSQFLLQASDDGDVDIPNGSLSVNGDIATSNGTTIWDSTNSWIPESRLENNDITINTGNAITGGKTLTLGDSTTLDVDESAIGHGNLSGITGTDHHTQYIHQDGRRGFTSPVEGVDPNQQTHLATKEYVDSVAQGLEFKESVISQQNSAPSSPTSGDRYLVGTSPSGDFSGHANELAEYDGSSWTFTTPNEGWSLFIEDNDRLKTFNSTEWILFGSSLSHSAMQDLSSDDHSQYLHRDGRRGMSGDLDISGNSIVDSSGVLSFKGGNVEVTDGEFHVGDAVEITNTGSPQINISDSGGQTTRLQRYDGGEKFIIRDQQNYLEIARFNDGGNVDIPNGSARLSTDGSLTSTARNATLAVKANSTYPDAISLFANSSTKTQYANLTWYTADEERLSKITAHEEDNHMSIYTRDNTTYDGSYGTWAKKMDIGFGTPAITRFYNTNEFQITDETGSNIFYVGSGGEIQAVGGMRVMGDYETIDDADGNRRFGPHAGGGHTWVYTNGSGGRIRLWDDNNGQDILTANEGGNVEIPNGDLVDGSDNVVYDQANSRIPVNRIEQGDGSGLDADSIDDYEAEDLRNPRNFAVLSSSDTSTDINQDTWTEIPWNVQHTVDTAYDHNASNSPGEITISEDGTYRIFVSLSYDTTATRVNPGIKINVNGTRKETFGLSGYIRSSSGHQEASNYVMRTLDLSSGDTVSIETLAMGNGGEVTLRANESILEIEQVSITNPITGDATTLSGLGSTDFLQADGSVVLSGSIDDMHGNTIYDVDNQWVPQAQVEQGNGSGLDADTLDGTEGADYTEKGQDIPLTIPVTKWSDGTSNEEIHRVELQSGETLELHRLEIQPKGGGDVSGLTVDVYDETNGTQLASTNDVTAGSPVAVSGDGASVTVRISNSSGNVQNASINTQMRIV